MVKYYLEEKTNTFVIENYNEAFPFSGFLPAISGVWGVPLWAFYVNRAQGIISFGIKDKDHAILEFLPANKAYQAVSFLGFRTFLKIEGKFYEPFKINSEYLKKERFLIRSFDLSIEEINSSLKLRFFVNYFTLPNMNFPAFVRILTVENLSSRKEIEIADGLPQVLPFHARDLFLKHLSRTLEAWMRTELRKIKGKNIAFFKLPVDPKDVSFTSYIEGANFAFSFYVKNNKIKQPQLIIDPSSLFSYDTSFSYPLNFLKGKLNFKTFLYGRTPSFFALFKEILNKEESITLYTILGGFFDAMVEENLIKIFDERFIQKKKKENQEIVESIKNSAFSISGLPVFDEYIKCSYLDNILRGGYPYRIKDKVYYVFSRKHGDLERDYNKFKFLPSYFSEGEANYRDINQNRRMDLFFNPFIYTKNIVYFMNLLRMDGYNPLLVRGEKLYFDKTKARRILRENNLPFKKEIVEFMEKGFYLGEIFHLLERKKINLENRENFAYSLLKEANFEPQAEFGEGFWIDHWRYNLDLIESFLYFFPDKKKELFLDTKFMFWDDEVKVKKRYQRYVIKEGRLYQFDSLEKVKEKKELIEKRERFKNFLRTDYGKGMIYQTNLLEKLLTLFLNKISSLDFSGIGVEMEADKPGWCDSLNGLPAILGSSLCETLELKRTINILKDGISFLKKIGIEKGEVCEEVFDFFVKIKKLLSQYFSLKKEKDLWWWHEANRIKESFRERVFWGIKGTKREITFWELEDSLNYAEKKLNYGIKKAKRDGLYYTYFFYEVRKNDVTIEKEEVRIKKFKRINLALSLEGIVEGLRVNKEKVLAKNIKKTSLYDKKLKMFRLNESLENAPLEIGRIKVFPRGWLENESVWLHMEYKYLLELLKNDLYEEFYKNFFNCCVCFLEPSSYGRNILENSSFIVSSVNPSSSLWGKGFIARLTGATAEIINIWILMCLGKRPFYVDEKNNLYIKFSPILKKELFTKKEIFLEKEKIKLPKNSFAFKLFSSVWVVYHNPERKDTYSDSLKIKRIEIIRKNKEKVILNKSIIPPPLSYEIRQKEVERIDIFFGS